MTADLSYDHLAASVWLRRGQDAGVRYARRAQQASKREARNSLMRLFTRRKWPDGLSLLTMPALDWSFERALIAQRESGNGLIWPRRTFITSVEASRPVWAAALRRMPGVHSSNLNLGIDVPAFAKGVACTRSIRRFYCCTFEDFVYGAADSWRPDWRMGAAWIDLCGPLTLSRLDALAALWQRVDRHLIVTSMRARWTPAINRRLADAGGVAELLMEVAPEAVAHSELLYQDTSPMHQVVLTRTLGNLGASTNPVSLPDGLTASGPTYKWPHITGSTNDH